MLQSWIKLAQVNLAGFTKRKVPTVHFLYSPLVMAENKPVSGVTPADEGRKYPFRAEPRNAALKGIVI